MECRYQVPTFEVKVTELAVDCGYRTGERTTVGFCSRPEFYRCIVDASNMAMPISYSAVNDFLTCHYLYYLKQIRGIKTRDNMASPQMKMGVLWDRCQSRLMGEAMDLDEVVEQYEIGNREVAKVKALYRAFKALEITIEPGFALQVGFSHEIPVYDEPMGQDTEIKVRGFYDRWYPNYFVENKLSGRPEMYLDLYFIQSQMGTYFMADPELAYVVMEIVRTPDLRSTGSNKDESDEAYAERTYQDIISRPSHYFLGWNNTSRTYGKKFYRSEFNLDELMTMYKNVSREIHESAYVDGWYKNSRVCNNILPGVQCDMLGVCRFNTMSETIYEIRKEGLA